MGQGVFFIKYHSAQPDFELNQAKQTAGIYKDALIQDFKLVHKDQDTNIIECSSGSLCYCYVTGSQCARKNQLVSEVSGSLHMASFLHIDQIFYGQHHYVRVHHGVYVWGHVEVPLVPVGLPLLALCAHQLLPHHVVETADPAAYLAHRHSSTLPRTSPTTRPCPVWTPQPTTPDTPLVLACPAP